MPEAGKTGNTRYTLFKMACFGRKKKRNIYKVVGKRHFFERIYVERNRSNAELNARSAACNFRNTIF